MKLDEGIVGFVKSNSTSVVVYSVAAIVGLLSLYNFGLISHVPVSFRQILDLQFFLVQTSYMILAISLSGFIARLLFIYMKFYRRIGRYSKHSKYVPQSISRSIRRAVLFTKSHKNPLKVLIFIAIFLSIFIGIRLGTVFLLVFLLFCTVSSIADAGFRDVYLDDLWLRIDHNPLHIKKTDIPLILICASFLFFSLGWFKMLQIESQIAYICFPERIEEISVIHTGPSGLTATKSEDSSRVYIFISHLEYEQILEKPNC